MKRSPLCASVAWFALATVAVVPLTASAHLLPVNMQSATMQSATMQLGSVQQGTGSGMSALGANDLGASDLGASDAVMLAAAAPVSTVGLTEVAANFTDSAPNATPAAAVAAGPAVAAGHAPVAGAFGAPAPTPFVMHDTGLHFGAAAHHQAGKPIQSVRAHHTLRQAKYSAHATNEKVTGSGTNTTTASDNAVSLAENSR